MRQAQYDRGLRGEQAGSLHYQGISNGGASGMQPRLQVPMTRAWMVVQAEGRRNDSGPASPSGRGNDRHLRVHGHSKLVKEFTDLCIVQELNAHNGESQGCSFATCQTQLLLKVLAGTCAGLLAAERCTPSLYQG